jgi:Arc/MetJ-type ribon-helix-helix transcriptional regulator
VSDRIREARRKFIDRRNELTDALAKARDRAKTTETAQATDRAELERTFPAMRSRRDHGTQSAG